MKKAIFPGSFDPFTIGHFSIVKRGLMLFDEITIGIGINNTKKYLLPIDVRIRLIRQAFNNNNRVCIKTYDSLTVDFAKAENAQFILRGIRSAYDFEYERSIADINKQLSGIETVLLLTDPLYSAISSTLVRDLISHGKDVSRFLPPETSL